MKRILALLMVLALVMTSLAGCGDKKDDTNSGDATEPELTVGFIYVGPAKDGGFSEAQDRGRLAMEEHFEGKVKTLKMESVKEEAQAVKTAALNLMDQGATVIVATSFGFMEPINDLAKEYPDVKFMHFSGNMMNDTNFGNYFGAMEQPRYLSGIIAGMTTKTNKLGYVAAFDYNELIIGINAYTLGAQSVNPNVEVKVVYTNSWHDPALEKQSAEALLDQGCDVIAQHCDTAGPQTAAEAVGAYAIGYNMDSENAAPKAYLTAPIWNHSAYYIDQVQQILDGTWKPESYYGTMADDYVQLAPMTDNVSAEAKAKVEEVQKLIKSGEFDVFSAADKDILYNDGSVMIPAGTTLTREDIWGLKDKGTAMTKLVQGAVGQ